MSEHICDPTVNPCPCGRRWEYYAEYAFATGTKRVYTSSEVVNKYLALYSGPSPYTLVAEEEAT